MNRTILTIISFVIYSIGCTKQSIFSLSDQNKDQVIAIQPLDNFDVTEMAGIMNEISTLYRRRVIVLGSMKVPSTFFNTRINMYSADSILRLVSTLQNDSIAEVIALTNHPIFAVRTSVHGWYYDEKIFGMGHQPGNACVISDYRLKTSDKKILNYRLRNVILHEVGHNLGLPHCREEVCIMSGKSGHFENLNRPNKAYCKKCRKKSGS